VDRLVFGYVGDFEGFVLDLCPGEHMFPSREPAIRISAETKIALDGMSPKQRHGKTGMRLQMHLVKIVSGLRRGRGHR
jgi:hypothetical protein